VPLPTGVALLFGSERFGMRNEDVYRCHVALVDTDQSGLRLAEPGAALQVLAYEWRMALGGFVVAPSAGVTAPRAADARQVAGLLAIGSRR
jgi:tRNA/rRNA methyltransferase